MKEGRTVQELAVELQRRDSSKRDFISPVSDMTVETVSTEGGQGSKMMLSMRGMSDRFELNHHFQRQLGSHLNIPAVYYDHLREGYGDLLDYNLNELLSRGNAKRMIRTLGGTGRAFLGSSYRRIDNLDLAVKGAFPVIGELGDKVQIASCQVTDSKLYIKVVFPGIEREVRAGDIVRSGFMISNSEVGSGKARVQAFADRLSCTNGMVVPANFGGGFEKVHLGRHMDSDNAAELFSDETKKADDRAFFLKVQDAVRAAMDETRFEILVDRMKESAGLEIEKKPKDAVIELVNRTDLTEGEGDSVLEHLLRGGELTQWGLINAVTRTAEDLESYDRATELEKLGGVMLNMSPEDWKAVSRN